MEDYIRPPKKKEQKQKSSKNIKEVIIIVVMIVCFALGYFAGYISKKTTVINNNTEKKGIVSEVYDILNKYWINTTGEDIDFDEAITKGMVSGLGDRHTSIFTSQEAVDFNQSVSGVYQGIGIAFSRVEKGIMVTKIYDHSPAQKEGIKVGDIIIKVDNHDLAGVLDEKVKEYVRGEEGTKVSLTLLRGQETISLKVARESLDMSTFYEIRKTNNTSFGYIELSTFGTDTASQVETALKEFKKKKVETLVLDLRGNGGGYLVAAEEILDLFFTSDEVIYQKQEKNDSVEKFNAKSDNCYKFKKNYILVDGDTASASELTAGALQCAKDFCLIGEQTYGKGSAQTQTVLSDGSVLKYTYAKWMLPNGKSINGKGLTPDVVVEGISTADISIETVDKTYQVDCVSSFVASMQKMLKILGYQVDREDGYFSNATSEALKTFEKDNNMTVNGEYDDNDRMMLTAKLLIYMNNHEDDKQYEKLLELIK